MKGGNTKMNGGYAIIDCSGVDLGDLGTVTGFYARVKDAIKTGKPLCFPEL